MTLPGYHDVAADDRSGLAAQVMRQRARVAARLATVGRVIVVLSGKGGVGKSYVTAALALAVARRGLAAGVVDADLYGPTVARLLAADARAPLDVHADGVAPTVGIAGIRIVSTDLLLDEGRTLQWTDAPGEAHAWRGAAESGVLREFLGDVRWGALDALLVDTPPDAGRLGDLGALLPRGAVAVAVTIPTDESARSVARALDAARSAGLPVAGLIENMSGVACPRCGHERRLFPGDAGARLAAAHALPLLARLPFTDAPLASVADALAPVAARLLGDRA